MHDELGAAGDEPGERDQTSVRAPVLQDEVLAPPLDQAGRHRLRHISRARGRSAVGQPLTDHASTGLTQIEVQPVGPRVSPLELQPEVGAAGDDLGEVRAHHRHLPSSSAAPSTWAVSSGHIG